MSAGLDPVAPHAPVYNLVSAFTREVRALSAERDLLTYVYDIEGAQGAGQVGNLAYQARALLAGGLDCYLVRVHLLDHVDEIVNAADALAPLLRRRCVREIFGPDSEQARAAWELELRNPAPDEAERYVADVWDFLGRYCGLPRPTDVGAALAAFSARWARVVEALRTDVVAKHWGDAGFTGFEFDLFGRSAITADGLVPLWSTDEHTGTRKS